MFEVLMERCRKEHVQSVIQEINEDWYTLRCQSGTYKLYLDLEVDRMPQIGDRFYLSRKNVLGGIKEKLYTYSFSAQHGSATAREPHNSPDEFLLVEYIDGSTVLLEQQYG